MPLQRAQSMTSQSRGTMPAVGALVSARESESAARREREDDESRADACDSHDDDDDGDDDASEDEVTTDVFEVQLGGGSSPWATAFLECASEGDLATVTKLLDEGKVDIDDVDVDGFTALMIAAAEAQTAVAMHLLERGADVSIRTHEMRSTALHFAAKSGIAEVVEAICEQDPQRVDAQNLEGDTPLVWACTEGRVDAVRALLKHNANVNVVSHRAMSALICAVMLREIDASDDGDDEDDDDHDHHQGSPSTLFSDADRAQIVLMLLQKNAKLVNYQDRDGSTAMHLAASHGYIKCVHVLLEYGADLTLRNAIGQTALEEAEETGISDLCVSYLRIIWKRLEEEAAARMMAMLEMEDASPNQANGKSSKKSNKKKQKKAKQKRPSKTTTTTTSTSTTSSSLASVDAAAARAEKDDDDDDKRSSGEGSSEDEQEGGEADKRQQHQVQNVQHIAATPPTESEGDVVAVKATPAADDQQHEQEEESKDAGAGPAMREGGVWTTVGRKHQQYLSQRAAEAATAAATPSVKAATPIAHGEDGDGGVSTRKKVLPVTPRSKTQRETTPSVSTGTGGPHRSASQAATPKSKDAASTSSSKKVTPVSPRSRPPTAPPLPSATMATTMSTSSASASTLTSPLSMGSPFSTFQSLHTTSRLYERYNDTGDALGRSSGGGGASIGSAASMWRGAPSTTRTSTLPFSLASVASASSASSTTSQLHQTPAIWRYTSPSSSLAASTTGGSKRWTSSYSSHSSNDHYHHHHARPAESRPVDDPVRRLLRCGFCGDLADDNLQCSRHPCHQLYCGSCLRKAVAAAASAAVVCVKCDQPIHPVDMVRNQLAHAQVATARASSSTVAAATTADSSFSVGFAAVAAAAAHTLDEMKLLMHHTSDKIQTLHLEPSLLMPNANLASLSVGQLDAIEEMHLLALQQITQARLENARAMERLRIDEYLKNTRDLFQFTSTTTMTTVAPPSQR